MPCEVKINVKEAVEEFTVEDDQGNVYLDKNNLKLEDLTAGPSIFQITVELDDKNEAVVDIRANLKSVPVSFKYNIPDDCAAEGRIDFPKTAAAASQSDLNKLADQVARLEERFAAEPR